MQASLFSSSLAGAGGPAPVATLLDRLGIVAALPDSDVALCRRVLRYPPRGSPRHPGVRNRQTEGWTVRAHSCTVCTAMEKNLRRIGIEEGRRTLPELASDALAGRATVLTRHGKPVAAIVPLGQMAERRRRAGLLSLRGTGKGLWGPSPARTIDALRREWEV